MSANIDNPQVRDLMKQALQLGCDYEDIQRQAILAALERHGWRQKEAADELGISPRVINYQIQTLGIRDVWMRGREAHRLAPQFGTAATDATAETAPAAAEPLPPATT